MKWNWGGFSLKRRVGHNHTGGIALLVLLILFSCFFLYSVYADLSLTLGDEAALPSFSYQDKTALLLGEKSSEVMATSAAYAALVQEDGALLWGKNPHSQAGMASTTKIMTALLAAEYIQSVGEDAVTVVSENAAGIEGSSIYLKVGERVRLIDLLYATLLASANDGAAALAEAVSGDLDSFVLLMNQRAEAMGLSKTHFENPHGLFHENHYTTAYELAILSAEAMKNSLFARVVETKHYTFAGEGVTRSLSNHNRMLSCYDGAIGVKTGYTKATGRCLVTAAEKDGVRLIAVTLSAPDDWNDHAAMLDLGFSMLSCEELLKEGEMEMTLPVVNGLSSTVTVTNTALKAVLRKGHSQLDSVIELPDFVYASVEAGDVLGRVVYYENGKVVASADLVATEGVAAIVYEKSFAERILSFFGLR